MITFNPITTSHPHYAFVENLLHSAFPQEERRDNEFQRENTDHNPKFECLCITDQETDSVIGLITVWSLNGFRYIEHLATSPQIRNKGYGLKIMNKLKETYPGIIILEVERPEDEMSTRRIGFYKRCGFELCNLNYMQPPYRKEDGELPLLLMYTGTDNIDNEFENIKNEIHREVYGVNS